MTSMLIMTQFIVPSTTSFTGRRDADVGRHVVECASCRRAIHARELEHKRLLDEAGITLSDPPAPAVSVSTLRIIDATCYPTFDVSFKGDFAYDNRRPRKYRCT